MENEVKFIEVDTDKFDDRCPNCGGKKFLDVHITGGTDGRRKSYHGLKCVDCGVILTLKIK